MYIFLALTFGQEVGISISLSNILFKFSVIFQVELVWVSKISLVKNKSIMGRGNTGPLWLSYILVYAIYSELSLESRWFQIFQIRYIGILYLVYVFISRKVVLSANTIHWHSDSAFLVCPSFHLYLQVSFPPINGIEGLPSFPMTDLVSILHFIGYSPTD